MKQPCQEARETSENETAETGIETESENSRRRPPVTGYSTSSGAEQQTQPSFEARMSSTGIFCH